VAHFLYEALARFIQIVLRSTLLHANKTTKKMHSFLNIMPRNKFIYIYVILVLKYKMKSQKYHTVGTILKIPYCRNNSDIKYVNRRKRQNKLYV
jgi:hypothetical protein